MKTSDKTQRANAAIAHEAYADARELTAEERETACRIIARVLAKQGLTAHSLTPQRAFHILAQEAGKWQ